MKIKSIKEFHKNIVTDADYQHYIDHINMIVENNANNAFITKNILKGKRDNKSLLRGIPCAIKDNMCTKGILTTNGSKTLHNFIPNYESSVTEALWNAGGVMVGKTNMDEFAMGSSGKNSYYGPSINPHRSAINPSENLTPGGSSSGSATAVAEGSALIAIGSDTGGSIRQPASLCGLVGIKPSYGMCSRYGMITYSSSLDQAGVIANNVQDAASILDIICFYDKHDPTSIPTSSRPKSFSANIHEPIDCINIGIINEYDNDIDPSIGAIFEQTIADLQAKGAKIKTISMPHIKCSPELYYLITTAEAYSNFARYDGIRYGHRTLTTNYQDIDEMYRTNRYESFGREVKRRMLIGAYVLSSGQYEKYFYKASQVRALIKQEFNEAFKDVDVILSPTSPNVAISLNEKQTPIEESMSDMFTMPANLAGLPGISVPAGYDTKHHLPVGMQLVAQHMEDNKMLRVAMLMESINNSKI